MADYVFPVAVDRVELAEIEMTTRDTVVPAWWLDFIGPDYPAVLPGEPV